jgi:hypothetical protein
VVRDWVLLLYKVAPEPSARRVYVWRKLKRLGALLLHDAVWVLPATPATLEQFQWLASEIRELEGSALVWEAHLQLEEQDNTLVGQFLAQVDVVYREIATELERPAPDLAALAKRYRRTQMQDYFHSALGEQVRAAVEAARGASAAEGVARKGERYHAMGDLGTGGSR